MAGAALTMVTVPETWLKQVCRKASVPMPVTRHYDTRGEQKPQWVTIGQLRNATGKTAQQIRTIRERWPEVVRLRDGKTEKHRDCYEYDLTAITLNNY